AAGALTARLVRGRVLAAVLSPLGSWFLVGMALRSAWLTQRRGGILWRGTLYPTALLRTGRRFDRS
ncbi:MAG TPA: hypothetical protein VEY30_03185, partial [Myxococcaceae bacterium]|nr:hypothetical protein [Myxococcaceae bacterium]